MGGRTSRLSDALRGPVARFVAAMRRQTRGRGDEATAGDDAFLAALAPFLGEWDSPEDEAAFRAL